MKPIDLPCELLEHAGTSVRRAEHLASVIRQGAATRDTAFLNNIIDAVADPILVKDEQQRILLVNQALCDFAGLARERFIGSADADLFTPAQAQAFAAKDRLVFETGLPDVSEEEHPHADGSLRSIRTTKTMFVDGDGAKVLVGIFTDLTALRAAQRELEAANRRLHQLAHHDSLTGLPNRMSFEAALERAVAGAQRHGENFTVLFMDLNGFKQVNDTHGHAAGDALIRATAARLAGVVRDSDFMARLGGDEFVVIARTAGNVEALHLAQRLAGAVAEPFELAAGTVGVSVSIGLANYPRDGRDGAALIRNADIAMYRAKRVTGQPFEFYDETQSNVARRQFLLESALRRDVEQGRIDIHLQPIVRLDDGCVLGFEALARWTHAQLGAISPAEFIPLAEASRLIAPLGFVVLRSACEFIARHARPGQYVSVNVSSRQLEDAGFADTLRGILAETGATPAQLAIELTESTFGSSDVTGVLQALRDIGIALFIDDFGVGYSNLMRLRQTPSDVIKIDRGFVSGIGSDDSGGASTAMIRTIVILAAELGLKVIAEGIEEEHQARTLRELGVVMGQGYFYGRPAPAPVGA